MTLAVLVETNGEVGRVGELEKVGVAIKQLENEGDDSPQILGGAIERDHEPVVRQRRFDNFVE